MLGPKEIVWMPRARLKHLHVVHIGHWAGADKVLIVK